MIFEQLGLVITCSQVLGRSRRLAAGNVESVAPARPMHDAIGYLLVWT